MIICDFFFNYLFYKNFVEEKYINSFNFYSMCGWNKLFIFGWNLSFIIIGNLERG